MTNTEIESFFSETEINLDNNTRIREPQLEGYQAALDFFSNRDSGHAILQIPVGCGKTGLMSILPFRLAKGRVLIITPNLEIRQGVSAALDFNNQNCFWNKINFISNFQNGPYRTVLDGRDANIHDCNDAHFVVTNIHQLASSADRWLPQFPDNYFDLIMVDEGHHNVANSWQRVFDRFPNAKIISLTATPFRSDGQLVSGQNIYRYAFSRAMRRGYIKQLTSINAAPSEIFFTYQGDNHHHTLEEVLQLREESWFRMGVALSRETNISIVNASIQCLERLRRSGFNHQIVAACCSINHAREVASLYRERGYNASPISSDLSRDERTEVINNLRSNNINVIVQVQILGEGFDHPPLSVAAIFRPFRSLSPYVQFVGRVMRVVQQNAPFHPDNEGIVVSHIGLQQDERWNDFRHFDNDDQILFTQLLNSEQTELPENDDDPEERERRRVRPSMNVIDEVIDRFLTDDFLDLNDQGAIDEAIHQIGQLLGISAEELGLTREELIGRLLAARQRADLRPRNIPVQPQEARRERRRRLDEETRSVAGRIIQALNLAPQAPTLVPLFPQFGSRNNIGVVIRIMHNHVNERLGFEAGTRGELSLEQIESAVDLLDEIGDQVQEEISARLNRG